MQTTAPADLSERQALVQKPLKGGTIDASHCLQHLGRKREHTFVVAPCPRLTPPAPPPPPPPPPPPGRTPASPRPRPPAPGPPPASLAPPARGPRPPRRNSSLAKCSSTSRLRSAWAPSSG